MSQKYVVMKWFFSEKKSWKISEVSRVNILNSPPQILTNLLLLQNKYAPVNLLREIIGCLIFSFLDIDAIIYLFKVLGCFGLESQLPLLKYYIHFRSSYFLFIGTNWLRFFEDNLIGFLKMIRAFYRSPDDVDLWK